MPRLILLGLGGCLGAIARYSLSGLAHRCTSGTFPVGTLLVNVLGCFAIGVVMGLIEDKNVLGSFTTFSALGYETVELLNDGQLAAAEVAESCGTVIKPAQSPLACEKPDSRMASHPESTLLPTRAVTVARTSSAFSRAVSRLDRSVFMPMEMNIKGIRSPYPAPFQKGSRLLCRIAETLRRLRTDRPNVRPQVLKWQPRHLVKVSFVPGD